MENGSIIKYGELVAIDRKCSYIDLKSNNEVARYYIQDYLLDSQSEDSLHIQFYRIVPLEYEGEYVRVYLDEDNKFYSVTLAKTLTTSVKSFSNLIENTGELNTISLIRKDSEKDSMALKRLVKKRTPSENVESSAPKVEEKTVESVEKTTQEEIQAEIREDVSISVRDDNAQLSKEAEDVVEENVKSTSSKFVFDRSKNKQNSVHQEKNEEKRILDEIENDQLESEETSIDETDVDSKLKKDVQVDANFDNIEKSVEESKSAATKTSIESKKSFTREEKNDILYNFDNSNADEETISLRKWCIEKALEIKFIDSTEKFVETCRSLERYLKNG